MIIILSHNNKNHLCENSDIASSVIMDLRDRGDNNLTLGMYHSVLTNLEFDRYIEESENFVQIFDLSIQFHASQYSRLRQEINKAKFCGDHYKIKGLSYIYCLSEKTFGRLKKALESSEIHFFSLEGNALESLAIASINQIKQGTK